MPDGNIIKLLQEGESYKYIGILEADKFRGDKIDGLEVASVLKGSKKEKRLEDWEEKVLHGQYLRQTNEVRSDQCWAWLQNGDLKRETESVIVSAENQSIRTNLAKAKIDKSQGDSLCRGCRKVDESIGHIVSGCIKLGSLLESVILKLEINGMNMSQKVF